MSVLGTNIKQLREKSSITQKDFAQCINVSNVVLSRYESGERNPDYETLIRIADYFHVTTDELLGHQLTYKTPNLATLCQELELASLEEIEHLQALWKIVKQSKA